MRGGLQLAFGLSSLLVLVAPVSASPGEGSSVAVSVFGGWVFWLALCVVLLLLEMTAPTFYLFFFGIAALITMVFAFFIHQIPSLLGIFVLSSAFLLIFIRPITRRMFLLPRQSRASNVAALVDAVGTITNEVGGDVRKGTIVIQGEEWSCIAAGPEHLPKGTRAKVLRISGNKVVVEPLPPEQSSRGDEAIEESQS